MLSNLLAKDSAELSAALFNTILGTIHSGCPSSQHCKRIVARN